MSFQQPGQPEVRTFPAAFDSECPNCPEWISEGEEIGYLPGDDKPSCPECVGEFG